MGNEKEYDELQLHISSTSFTYASLATCAMAVPVLVLIFSTLYRSLYRKDIFCVVEETWTNIILIFILILPGFVCLIIVIPQSNVDLFLTMYGLKLVCLPASVIYYLYQYGGDLWKSYLVLLSWILYNIGILVHVFQPYMKISSSVQTVVTLLSLLGFLVVAFRWIKGLWSANYINGISLSRKEISCLRYVSMGLIISLIQYILFYSFGQPSVSEMSPTYLTSQTLIFSLLFVAIPAFQIGSLTSCIEAEVAEVSFIAVLM